MTHPTEQDREKAEALVERIRDNDYDGYTLNIDAAADAVAQAIADAREQEREACLEVAVGVLRNTDFIPTTGAEVALRREMVAAFRARQPGSVDTP